MKTVYSYENYRKFLNDFYLAQKNQNSSYTYAKFAEEAELNSPNYLKLVIDGKRNLTITNIHQFAKALRLNFEETCYFEALILRDQASTSIENKFYSSRLNELKTGKPRGIKIRYSEFISKWYFPAIVVALNGLPDNTPLKEVAKKIGITEAELNDAVGVLKKRNILGTLNGNYFIDSNHITYHDPKLSNVFQKNYLKAQLEKSVEAFQKKYAAGAKFYSHTFTVPVEQFAQIGSHLHSYIENIIAKADEGPPEKVAQLNLQLFNLGD